MRNTHIPWLLLKFIIISLNISLISSQCLNSQRTLLLQLKDTFQYNSLISTKLSNWDTTKTADCCHWPGVACDMAGHVTHIDLSNEFIQKGIQNSTKIFSKLSFLHTLNLANNSFYDIQIPPDFGHLVGLQTLNLSKSGFTGQIPIEFSRLVNLKSLDLSRFYFPGRPDPGTPSLVLQNPDLSTLITNLTMLTELRLDGVNISSRGSDWCEVVSSLLPNLKVLSLASCYLSGPLDNSFGKMNNLSKLNLDSNDLSVPVPEFFASFVNLSVLSLTSCNLSGTFPSKIFHLPKLRILNLAYNPLLVGSLPVFGQNEMIERLVLTETNFSGPLPYSIGNLKNLSSLVLSGCQFSGPIPSSMANLTQLVSLDLQDNHFMGSIPSFQRWKNLAYVDLSNNTLTGSIPSTHFEGLTKLEWVALASNSLHGSIPASLFSLPSLQNIVLNNNQFSGEISEPRNKSFSQLDTLDISSNNLQGNVPQFLFRFPKLNSLSLAFNNFSGYMQLDVIGNLESLDLSYNDLSISLSDTDSKLSIRSLRLASCNLKTFPALNNQTKMMVLDLSDNQITGKIPNWVRNQSLLYLNLSSNFLEELGSLVSICSTVIDLRFNLLKGEIPVPSASALHVDYSNNYFSSIPADIGNNLTSASYFSVSNNMLEGSIPQSICSCFNLQVLDLSNNRFNGSIPSCLLENRTETLGVLNLGNNLLTGTMKGKFHKSCALVTLDFNGNRLKGKVPKSLANCKLLEVLNLRDNQINDVFPCFMKTSSNLRVLVLRLNDFQGDIRCSDSITWPKLQIIDLAQNNFSGKLPSGSFLRWEAMMSYELGPKHIIFEFRSFDRHYYQDTVTVTNKGQDMKLVKILIIYTCIDFSSNRFEGHIPEAIGGLKSLYVLNLSHNALTSQIPSSIENLKQLGSLDLSRNKLSGEIPSSIGNLKQLGSLDLSRNKLSGEIPNQLTDLSFLAVLNVSYNNLVGRIPKGSQFNTFSSNSYEGNPNLCGLPLNNTCTRSTLVVSSPTPSSKYTHSNAHEFCSGVAVGYLVGLGTFIGSLLLCKKWKKWFFKQTDRILELMFHLEEKQRKRIRHRLAYRDPIRML